MTSSISRAALLAFARLALILLLVPVAVFGIFEHYFYLSRAWINIDYLLLAILIMLVPSRLYFTLFYFLFPIILIDLFFSVSPGYHFTPKVAFASVVELAKLDLAYVLTAGFSILALSLLVSLLGVRFSGSVLSGLSLRDRFQVGGAMLLCVLSLVLAEATLNRMGATDDGRTSAPVDLVTSGSMRLLKAVRIDAASIDGMSLGAAVWGPTTASDSLFSAIRNNEELPDNIVFVIVESLGDFKLDLLNRAQSEPLLSDAVREKYNIDHGTVLFGGATVSAEFRELCKLQINRYPKRRADVDGFGCLPRALSSRGYRSLSYHGYSSALFNRRSWYRSLGFDDSFFAGNLYDSSTDLCGNAFKGICDYQLARAIGEELDSNAGKKFIYWLTLDAHLPSSDPVQSRFHTSCENLKLSGSLCNLVNHHRAVMGEVATLALLVDAARSVFVVVGDHSPPYLSSKLRRYFHDNTVPYFVLSAK